MNNLEVLYEDNHIIVVVKPYNILSQSDNTNDLDMLTIIKAYLKEKYNKPGNVYLGLVHRLDRPVGGVMIFAKTSKAASRLSEEVRTRVLKKTYIAVVNGIIEKDKDELIDYIVKCDDNSSKITVKEKGKIAKLKYEVIERNLEQNLTLIKINLETGRHHQIRVQMANIGHPLYGDQRYGKQDKKQIALFSCKLEFIHPTKKEPIIIEKYPTKEGIWEVFKSVK